MKIDRRDFLVSVPVAAAALVANSQLGVLSRLGLASALRLQGDLAAAGTEYQEFLNIWKDADPASPILVRAKSEYAKLR